SLSHGSRLSQIRVPVEGSSLELYVWCLERARVGYFKVLGLGEVKHPGDYVLRKALNLGVELAHVGVVETAACGNAIFGVGEFRLELQEVYRCLQVRVSLRD